MSYVTVSMNPAQSTLGMRRDLERLIQDVVPGRASNAFTPAANGYEDANGFRMEFEVPGFAPQELEVTAQEGVLVVRGTKEASTPAEGTRTLFAERSTRSFERRMRLPKSADVGSITATHAHGVLTVHVAKLAAVAPRKVAITVGDVTPAPDQK